MARTFVPGTLGGTCVEEGEETPIGREGGLMGTLMYEKHVEPVKEMSRKVVVGIPRPNKFHPEGHQGWRTPYSDYCDRRYKELFLAEQEITEEEEEEIEKKVRKRLNGIIPEARDEYYPGYLERAREELIRDKASDWTKRAMMDKAEAEVEAKRLEDYALWKKHMKEKLGSYEQRLETIFNEEEKELWFKEELKLRIKAIEDSERREQIKRENPDLWATVEDFAEADPDFVAQRLAE